MDQSIIQSTANTPLFIINPAGQIVFKGRLIAEDPSNLFRQINKSLDNYFSLNRDKTTIEISLEYINSAGIKSILDMLARVCLHNDRGNVRIVWCYSKVDEDMMEKGIILSSIIGFPFDFQLI